MWVFFFMFTEAVVSVFMPRCLLPGGLCKQYKTTNMLHSKRFYVVSVHYFGPSSVWLVLLAQVSFCDHSSAVRL